LKVKGWWAAVPVVVKVAWWMVISAVCLTISMQGNSFSNERGEIKDFSTCKLPMHVYNLSENMKTFCSRVFLVEFTPLPFRKLVL